MKGDTGLFRGSELPRLLLLLAIMAIGWPLAVIYMVPRHESQPTQPPGPIPPLPPADADPAFASVRDKTRMRPEETEAYALLLERARQTPSAELASRARREVMYADLLERPDRYRGLPIHLEGTARKIHLLEDISPRFASGGRLYEAGLFTNDSINYPYLVVFEELPSGLQIGADLYEKVRFDGYFFKLLVYDAGDVTRFAPLLVGRLHGGPGGSARDRNTSLYWTLLPLILFTAYVLVRWAFHLRRLFSPAPTAPKAPSPVVEIAPESLSEWLDQASDRDEADEESDRTDSSW